MNSKQEDFILEQAREEQKIPIRYIDLDKIKNKKKFIKEFDKAVRRGDAIIK